MRFPHTQHKTLYTVYFFLSLFLHENVPNRQFLTGVCVQTGHFFVCTFFVFFFCPNIKEVKVETRLAFVENFCLGSGEGGVFLLFHVCSQNWRLIGRENYRAPGKESWVWEGRGRGEAGSVDSEICFILLKLGTKKQKESSPENSVLPRGRPFYLIIPSSFYCTKGRFLRSFPPLGRCHRRST